MKTFVVISALLFLASTFMGIARADDLLMDPVVVDPEAAEEFAMLPGDLRFPEGITANPANGDIYVGTFDGGVANSILQYDEDGQLTARRDLGITPLLGLAFNSRDNMVYFCSIDDFTFGGSKIRRIAADLSGPVEDVALIPSVGAPPNRIVDNPDGSEDEIVFGNFARVPNALAFNRRGDLFVSDSFQGAVLQIDRAHACDTNTPCNIEVVAHDGLLATAGFPPFGANGLALSGNQQTLYVTNTGDDRILAVNISSGTVSVFAESINGADGIGFDAAGNLWIAANQADQVVALNNNGRVIANLGAFFGIDEDGAPVGLLFPASLIIVNDRIFVTNLALPLTGADGDEPEEIVSIYTVSSIDIPEAL